MGLSQVKKEKYIEGKLVSNVRSMEQTFESGHCRLCLPLQRGTIPWMAPELFYGASTDGGRNFQEDQVRLLRCLPC